MEFYYGHLHTFGLICKQQFSVNIQLQFIWNLSTDSQWFSILVSLCLRICSRTVFIYWCALPYILFRVTFKYHLNSCLVIYMLQLGYTCTSKYAFTSLRQQILTTLLIKLQMNSYFKMNRDYREQYLQEITDTPKEPNSQKYSKYPENINFNDFIMYLVHPTFSY